MTPQEEEEGGHERRGADFRHRHREQLYHREQRRHGQEGGDQPDQRPPRTRRRVCTCRRHGASGIATAPAQQQQQGRDRPVWLQDRGRPGATTSARVPRAASLPRRLCHVDAHHRQHGTTATSSFSLWFLVYIVAYLFFCCLAAELWLLGDSSWRALLDMMIQLATRQLVFTFASFFAVLMCVPVEGRSSAFRIGVEMVKFTFHFSSAGMSTRRKFACLDLTTTLGMPSVCGVSNGSSGAWPHAWRTCVLHVLHVATAACACWCCGRT